METIPLMYHLLLYLKTIPPPLSPLHTDDPLLKPAQYDVSEVTLLKNSLFDQMHCSCVTTGISTYESVSLMKPFSLKPKPGT